MVGVVPVAQLARLGPVAFIALVAFAVMVVAVICWILLSHDRCERLSRILLALRGNSAALTSASGTATTPTPGPHLRRAWPWQGRWPKPGRGGSRPGRP